MMVKRHTTHYFCNKAEAEGRTECCLCSEHECEFEKRAKDVVNKNKEEVRKVYEKYKYLDKLILDNIGYSFEGEILKDIWKVIKLLVDGDCLEQKEGKK